MNPNFRDLTREKKEVQMKNRLMTGTTLATTTLATMRKLVLTLCCSLLMLFAAPAWAQGDQCSGALSGGFLGTATGCGALITVTAVNGGTATAFTVTIPNNGNGNPFDGAEDTLIGIQNSSGAPLTSIKLSSPDTRFGGIFSFDSDGVCSFNPGLPQCTPLLTGYEGPDNTFNVDTGTSCPTFVTCFTSGTVTFTRAIPVNGSTYFALEGTPLSLTTISQTFILQPGVTVSVPVGTSLYKFKPLDNVGGESLTITPFPILESFFDFGGGDPTVESCVPVRDLTEAAGAHTCLEFQHDCTGADCATFHYQVVFNYDLPVDLRAIGGPDWGIKHGVPCPQFAGGFPESIFLSFSVNRFDPRHAGGGGGPSCNAPEWTPGVTPITAAGFVGFDPPVSDTNLNRIEAEQNVPLKWLQLDQSGNPVPNLTLCTNPTGSGCAVPWVMLQSTRIACPGKKTPKTVGLKLLEGDFKNLGKGHYRFNWETDEDSRGCVTVVLTFELTNGAAFVVASPANFKFKLDDE